METRARQLLTTASIPLADWGKMPPIRPTRQPPGAGGDRLCLDNGEHTEYSSVLRLFWLPFVKIFRMKSGLPVLSGGLIGVALLALTVSSALLIASPNPTPELAAVERITD